MVADSWLAPRDLELGEIVRWRVGPRQIWLQRQAREWTLATDEGQRQDDRLDAEIEADPVPAGDDAEYFRFAFARTDPSVRLRPALADRPVVSSPRLPLFVPAGESVTLFVGSPLWIRIEVGEPSTVLRELPVRRPSDTWFGSVTGAGELCYSTRTRAALAVENLERTAAAAITPVTIHNHAAETLAVEKLKLPVPFLPIYAAEDRLWTPAVTMRHRAGHQQAVFDVAPGAPDSLSNAELLAEARAEPDPGLLINAFGGLLQTVMLGDRS